MSTPYSASVAMFDLDLILSSTQVEMALLTRSRSGWTIGIPRLENPYDVPYTSQAGTLSMACENLCSNEPGDAPDVSRRRSPISAAPLSIYVKACTCSQPEQLGEEG